MEGGGDLFCQAGDKHDFTKPKKINFCVVGKAVRFLSVPLCVVAGDSWV